MLTLKKAGIKVVVDRCFLSLLESNKKTCFCFGSFGWWFLNGVVCFCWKCLFWCFSTQKTQNTTTHTTEAIDFPPLLDEFSRTLAAPYGEDRDCQRAPSLGKSQFMSQFQATWPSFCWRFRDDNIFKPETISELFWHPGAFIWINLM